MLHLGWVSSRLDLMTSRFSRALLTLMQRLERLDGDWCWAMVVSVGSYRIRIVQAAWRRRCWVQAKWGGKLALKVWGRDGAMRRKRADK